MKLWVITKKCEKKKGNTNIKQIVFPFGRAETEGFEPSCRLPDNLISSQARYGHFDTSPVPIYYTMVLMEFQILFHKYFTNTEKGN